MKQVIVPQLKRYSALEYFSATHDFETMVLPYQDAALGENPDAEEDPSVMEKILSPIGKALQDAVSAIAGS